MRARWVAWCLPVVVAGLSSGAHAFVSPGNYQGGGCRVPSSILGKWRLRSWRLGSLDLSFTGGRLEIGHEQFAFSLEYLGGGWAFRIPGWRPAECGAWGVRFHGASADWDLRRFDKDGLLVVRKAGDRIEEFAFEREP